MKFNKINYRRIFTIVAILSLSLSYSLLWLSRNFLPKHNTAVDFVSFYAAGGVAQTEGASHIYDLSLIRKNEELVVGKPILREEDASPFLHPPFIVPVLSLVTVSGNYAASFIWWNLIMVAFFILGTIPLMYLVKRDELPGRQQIVLLSGILLFLPFYHSIYIGQDSAILYFGLCVWVYGIATGKDWVAGLGLSIATIRPHIALLLATPFLFSRRSVWWWFLVGATVLGVISVASVGVEGIKGFIQALLISGRGDDYNTNERNMVNLIAVMLRIFPFIPAYIIRLIGWVFYGATWIGLCILFAKSEKITEKVIGIAIMWSIFAAPHLHFQDLSIMVIPLLMLLIILIRLKYWNAQDALLLPLIVSGILFLSSFSITLFHSVHYIVEFYILAGLLFPSKILFWKRITWLIDS